MKRIWYIGALAVAAGVLIYSGVATSDMESIPGIQEMEFSYGAVIRNIPPDAQSLQVWIPLPRDDARQSVSALRIESPFPFREVTDSEYGNRLLFCELSSGLPDSLPFTMTFRVRRYEAAPLAPADSGAALRERLRRFLAPNALVPIDGAIAREADSVTRGAATPMDEARALYDHVLRTMRYDKSGSGWGQGDAVFACTERRGNCTDIHSLLIGMARAQGIPARFVIGFPIPSGQSEGTLPGYHCWADLYIDDRGWIPVDASEAIKHPRKAGYYFGKLDEHRVAFTIGRDIHLESGSEDVVANYFIYPEVRVDGRAYSEVAREFKFRMLPATDG